MMTLTEILGDLERWAKLGRRDLENGDVQLGRIRTEFGMGWAVKLAAPVDLSKPTTTGFDVPNFEEFPYYTETLRQLNSLNLFSNALFLYGVHIGTQSSPCVVFDIYPHNAEERDLTTLYNAMAIGGSELDDQSLTYLQQRSGQVIVIDARTQERLAVFKTIEEMLAHQIAQIEEALSPSAELPEEFVFQFETAAEEPGETK